MEKQWFTYGDSVNKNNKPEKCWCCRLGLLTMMTRRKIISRKKGTNERTRDSQAKPSQVEPVVVSFCLWNSLSLAHHKMCTRQPHTDTPTPTHNVILKSRHVDVARHRAFCFWNVECVCKRDDHNNKWNFIKLNWDFFSALHAACLKAWGMRLCVECVICVFVPIFFSK